jgi:hypothetical protein
VTNKAFHARRTNESSIAENEKYLKRAQLLQHKKKHLLKIIKLEKRIASRIQKQNMKKQVEAIKLKKSKNELIKKVKKKQ